MARTLNHHDFSRGPYSYITAAWVSSLNGSSTSPTAIRRGFGSSRTIPSTSRTKVAVKRSTSSNGFDGLRERCDSARPSHRCFAWNGKTYRSLSAVAQAITGTRWNGPKFLACVTSHRRTSKNQEQPRIKTGSLHDLHPSLDRPGTRAGLQLPRRPIRCLSSLYPKPGPCRLDPDPV